MARGRSAIGTTGVPRHSASFGGPYTPTRSAAPSQAPQEATHSNSAPHNSGTHGCTFGPGSRSTLTTSR